MMTANLPDNITQLIEPGLQWVKSNPARELRPYDRKRIYQAFGPSNYQDGIVIHLQKIENSGIYQLNLTTADRVYGYLNVLGAKHVKSILDEVAYRTPSDRALVEHWLEIAQNMLEGDAKAAREWMENETNFIYFVDGFQENTSRKANLALWSYFTSMRTIFTGPLWQPEISWTDEKDILPGEFDTASVAMRAYCATGDGNQESYSVEKRQEFWEWWLSEAIPQAWDLAHSVSPQ